jgi:Flp pilus assembly pilin Flp
MNALLSRLWTDESGQDAGDFAVFIALVAIALVVAYGPLRRALAARFAAAAAVLEASRKY